MLRASLSIVLWIAIRAAVVVDIAVGGYLVFFGGRGLLNSDGMGEGLISLVAIAAGVLAGSCGVVGALLWRGPRERPRRAAALVMVALPWLAGVWWMRPDPWSFPKRPEVRCFSPALRDKVGEVGWTVDGKTVVVHLLFPSRTSDFVYVVSDERSLNKYPMDCSDSLRCRYANGTDDELRAALARLPTCE